MNAERLPSSARAVIVGGGIAGASVAHHLALQGWDDLVLIDRAPLWRTGGSTSHAPGLVFQHNASRTMTRLAHWTVELLTELGCFHPVGGVEVATTEERWAELDRRAARARGYGLDARLLTPAEVVGLIPLIDENVIVGGFHVADDGIAKALDAAAKMGDGAVAGGAMQAFGSCEATGLIVENGRVAGVETPLGTIRSEHVVIACGIWGPLLARLAPGLNVPLVPVQHQLAYTAPLPELAGETREVVHPILRHQDHSMYFRQVADAYAIGNYRHEPLLTDPEDIRDWGDDGEQPSIEHFTEADFHSAYEESGRLMPALQGVELVRAFNGLMSFTAGRVPAARRERRGARALARAGDLGHALGRLRPRACRADDARRRPRGPPRGRPAALRRPRHDPRLRARAEAPRATARSTTCSTRASSRSRCAASARRRSTSASSSSAPCSSRAPAGSGRSGTAATASC